MTLMSTLRGLLFVARTSLRFAFSMRRLYVLSIAISIVTMVFAVRFSMAAFQARQVENPVELWLRGPDGALASLAFGLMPLLLPALPMGLVYDLAQRDRSLGLAEVALTRPIPRWVISTGKFLGFLAAISVPVLLVGGLALLIIQGFAGSAPSASLAGVFLGATILLVALYLGLVLALSSVFAASQTLWLAFLAWLSFNLLSGTGVIIMAQHLLIVSVSPVELTIEWRDFASFTGMFNSVLALAVPSNLGFVHRPTIIDLPGLFVYNGAPMMIGVWMVSLLFAYLVLSSRYPLGR